MCAGVDSYSALEEADRKTPSGLQGYLRELGIKRVFVTGLATDFCVAWIALDARKAAFETYAIEEACRGFNLNGSIAAAWREMAKRGVKRIQSTDIELGWLSQGLEAYGSSPTLCISRVRRSAQI